MVPSAMNAVRVDSDLRFDIQEILFIFQDILQYTLHLWTHRFVFLCQVTKTLRFELNWFERTVSQHSGHSYYWMFSSIRWTYFSSIYGIRFLSSFHCPRRGFSLNSYGNQIFMISEINKWFHFLFSKLCTLHKQRK